MSFFWRHNPKKLSTLHEADWLLQELEKISAKHPGWALVPGTILIDPKIGDHGYFNIAPVYLNGELLHLISKYFESGVDEPRPYHTHHLDQGEVLFKDQPVPFTSNGKFEIDAIQFRLEICLDHAYGKAQYEEVRYALKQERSLRGALLTQFHLLLSNSIGYVSTKSCCASNGEGAVSHCDVTNKMCGLHAPFKQQMTWVKVSPPKRQAPEGGASTARVQPAKVKTQMIVVVQQKPSAPVAPPPVVQYVQLGSQPLRQVRYTVQPAKMTYVSYTTANGGRVYAPASSASYRAPTTTGAYPSSRVTGGVYTMGGGMGGGFAPPLAPMVRAFEETGTLLDEAQKLEEVETTKTYVTGAPVVGGAPIGAPYGGMSYRMSSPSYTGATTYRSPPTATMYKSPPTGAGAYPSGSSTARGLSSAPLGEARAPPMFHADTEPVKVVRRFVMPAALTSWKVSNGLDLALLAGPDT